MKELRNEIVFPMEEQTKLSPTPRHRKEEKEGKYNITISKNKKKIKTEKNVFFIVNRHVKKS